MRRAKLVFAWVLVAVGIWLSVAGGYVTLHFLLHPPTLTPETRTHMPGAPGLSPDQVEAGMRRAVLFNSVATLGIGAAAGLLGYALLRAHKRPPQRAPSHSLP